MFKKEMLEGLGEIHHNTILEVDTYYTNGLHVDIPLDVIEEEWSMWYDEENPPDDNDIKWFLSDLIENEIEFQIDELKKNYERRLSHWRQGEIQ